MKTISEQRVLKNVRLTKHQKAIIAMIVAAPEGIVPDEDISKDRNHVAARDTLFKVGLIDKSADNEYSVTEKGMDVAKEENIVNDMGSLTPEGEKFAYVSESLTFKQFISTK